MYLIQHFILHTSSQAFSSTSGITLGPFICTLSSGNFIPLASDPVRFDNAPFNCRCLSAMILLKLDLNFKPPAEKVFKQVGSVVCRPRVLAFLLAFMCAGVLWGCMETFLFWHLEDLGATKLLMGLSLAVGTVAGVPLTIFSSQILGLFGHEMVAFVSLALYSVRMLGYSLIRHAGKDVQAMQTYNAEKKSLQNS